IFNTHFYKTNFPWSAISRLQSPFSPAYAGYVQGHGGGPKSRAGKAASSRNAVTHGLTASAPVVRQVESIEDWERHAEQVTASIEPEGYLETQPAVRAAAEANQLPWPASTSAGRPAHERLPRTWYFVPRASLAPHAPRLTPLLPAAWRTSAATRNGPSRCTSRPSAPITSRPASPMAS